MAYEDDQAIAEMMPAGTEPMPAQGKGDLLAALQELSAQWQPETDEGIQYKADLDAVIAQHMAA
tara:strand:- start:206 stop:397 length:192 start_codon:yes stop_codon:yes gene_type:complete